MTLAATAMVAVLALAAPARADPAKKVPELTPREAIVAIDALAALFIGLGFAVDYATWDCDCDTAGGVPFWMLGGMNYVAHAPYAHGKEGNLGRAMLSGASRIALPTAALWLARSRDWDLGPTLLVTYGGVASAMALDWLVLSRVYSHRAAPVSIYAAPIGGDGVIAGVGGSF